MAAQKDITDSELTLLIEIEGRIHLVGMDRERLSAVQFLIKNSIAVVVPTERSQQDLNEFLYAKVGALDEKTKPRKN